MFDLDSALTQLVGAGGSDLHLKVPSRPLGRIHGTRQPLGDFEPLTPDDTIRTLQHMLRDPNKQAEFQKENEVDFAYTIDGVARFRVNAFRQRGSISIV